MSRTTTRRDLYADITASIVTKLEAGTLPWRCDWQRSGGASPFGPIPRRATGEQYRGINVLLLWMASAPQLALL